MAESNLKRKLAIGAGVLAAVAAGGGAYAATQSSTNPRQAFLNDVAKRLHISEQQLQAALQGAFFDRLQAAVAAGQLTQAEANAIKQRIQRYGLAPGGPGLFGRPGFFGPHRFFGRPGLGGERLSPAASYLGISEAQLLDQIRAGKSLAQLAQSRGKSVAGLKAALLGAARARLEEALRAKLITSAQEQQILSRMSSRLDELINRKGGRAHMRMGRFFGPGEPPPGPGLLGPPPGEPPPGAASAGPQPGGPAD